MTLCLPQCLKTFFIDLQRVSILMIIWLIIVIFIMIEIGIFSNNEFVAFGPRESLSFMKVPINTYYKYNMLIVMIILHTFITDFIADSLSPHVLNVVQDPKTKYIPHKPYVYIGVTTFWALYCSITQLFVIFIAFAQLDLLLVRLASDICANFLTTSLYLHGKEYNPTRYKVIEMRQIQTLEENHQYNENDMESSRNFGMEILEDNENEPKRPNAKQSILYKASSQHKDNGSDDSVSNPTDSDVLLKK